MDFASIQIAWNSPELQASLVSSSGMVLAALITGICAMIIGKQITGRKKLEEYLQLARNDIAFLLAVEEEHCKKHVSNGETSHKLTIRERVRSKGHHWSGKFTAGQLAKKRARDLVSHDKGPSSPFSFNLGGN